MFQTIVIPVVDEQGEQVVINDICLYEVVSGGKVGTRGSIHYLRSQWPSAEVDDTRTSDYSSGEIKDRP